MLVGFDFYVDLNAAVLQIYHNVKKASEWQ